MTILASYDHTAAVAALLATAGYPVGLNQAPTNAAPYFVLYPISSGPPDGPLADPDADWFLQYQVTSVGVGPEQAAGLADLARATLQGSPVIVSGRSVWRMEALQTGVADRDDSYQPPLHYMTETFQLGTTPT